MVILNKSNLLFEIEDMINKCYSEKEKIIFVPEWCFTLLKEQIKETGMLYFDTTSKYIKIFNCLVVITSVLFHNKIIISDDENFIEAMYKSLEENERIKNCRLSKRKSIGK